MTTVSIDIRSDLHCPWALVAVSTSASSPGLRHALTLAPGLEPEPVLDAWMRTNTRSDVAPTVTATR